MFVEHLYESPAPLGLARLRELERSSKFKEKKVNGDYVVSVFLRRNVITCYNVASCCHDNQQQCVVDKKSIFRASFFNDENDGGGG